MEQPNLKYIKQLSQGDTDFEHQLVDVLKKELPEEYNKFLESIEEKKFIKTAEHVHKLKHKISILGLAKGYEESAKFEKDLRERKSLERYESFVKTVEIMVDFLQSL